MLNEIQKLQLTLELYFNHENQKLIYELDRDGVIVKREVGSQGTLCIARVPQKHIEKWKLYSVTDEKQ